MSDKKNQPKLAFGTTRLMVPIDHILPIRKVDATGKKLSLIHI